MRKKIIIIILLLFLLSFIIVTLLGRKATIEYKIGNAENISIDYDKSIIECDEEFDNGILKLKISSLKKGNTNIFIKFDEKNEDSTIEQKEYKKSIFVHSLKIITVDNFFGNCSGDISIIISFLISLAIILLYVLRQFIRGIKKNMYEYRNIRLLGLIIFISIILVWQLYAFIIDTINNYHMSLYLLLQEIKSSSMVFSSFMLPVAFLTTILLTISNVELIIKEGKSWKNALGVILGSFLCISTFLFIVIGSLPANHHNLFDIVKDSIPFLFSVCISYLECILIGTIIMGIISSKHTPKDNKDYIIILGCKIKEDGTLLPLLKSRVDRAIEFANKQKQKTDKNIVFVPSGGKGKDEIISEAEAMKNYLLKQGINEKNIIIENKSKNTYENIKFSNKLIKEKNNNPSIVFCTSNYHVFRAGNIASNQGLYIDGIGAKTKTYYWINAFIREFVATLVSEKNKHIKTIIVLMILFLIIYFISSVSTIL